MVIAQLSNALSRSSAKSARTLIVLSLAAILTGCETVSDLDAFGIFDDDQPAAETAGQASVPARPDEPTPPDVRQRVAEGLVADRENARYSDQVIRLQGPSRESSAAATTTANATTTAPPPPQVDSAFDRRAESPAQLAPPPPPQTARASPPLPDPIPLATGPSPSVQVDATAISGGSGFSTIALRGTIDEQVATIHFAHSSSKLEERDKIVIAQVASAQRQNGAEVIVVGHASGRTQQLDRVEHDLANFRISLARANRVATQLIEMGVAPEKVRVEASADDKRLYSEAMPTGEAGNRRVEIYFRQ